MYITNNCLLWHVTQETYKYKELDDELEEELRLEMEEHARAAKQEAIELEVTMEICGPVFLATMKLSSLCWMYWCGIVEMVQWFLNEQQFKCTAFFKHFDTSFAKFLNNTATDKQLLLTFNNTANRR